MKPEVTSFYRPDVDGLRALAVIAVLTYHLNSHALAGGFLGVDVFFVISGFVIAGLLLREFDTSGTINIRAFYWRRFRRLAPAFSLVLVTSVLATVWSVSAFDASDSLKAAMAAIIGLSNIWFLNQDSYEAVQGQIQPFLHTWSLGVEEQFYVLAPAVLVAIFGSQLFKKHRIVVAFAISAVLLVLGMSIGPYVSAEFNFYSPITRFWELGIGVFLAIGPRAPKARGRGIVPATISLASLVVLAWSLMSLDHLESGPTPWTLVPVVATAVLIYLGPETLVARILSIKPAVFLGKISYPLYLWHWPLIVFWPVWFGQPGPWGLVGSALISILLAALTYRWIESPVRLGKLSAKTWVPIALLATAASGVLGAIQVQRVTIPNFAGQELADSPGGQAGLTATVAGRGVIVVGDSHASSLGPIVDIAHEHGLDVGYSVYRACPFLIQVTLVSNSERSDTCTAALQERRLSFLEEQPRSFVVLFSRWPVVFGGPGLPDVRERQWETVDGSRLSGRELIPILQQTVDSIEGLGHTVVLVYPTPDSFLDPVPRQLTQSHDSWPPLVNVSIPVDEWNERKALSYEVLDGIEGQDILREFPDAVFCDSFEPGSCVGNTAEQVFYRDSHHLSESGAIPVARLIVGAIEEQKAR